MTLLAAVILASAWCVARAWAELAIAAPLVRRRARRAVLAPPVQLRTTRDELARLPVSPYRGAT